MIGWYVHHHGTGHLNRMQSVRAHMDVPLTAFSSRPGPGVQPLPIDVDPPRSEACATSDPAVGFHYAPLGVDGIRQRMSILAEWVRRDDPDVFVVDVSVEVAALMRLLSVPTVIMRQHGGRDDLPHRMCYSNASVLLAPYPMWLEDERTPDWVRHKTVYAGGFSRFDDQIRTPDGDADPDDLNMRDKARQRLGISPDTRLVVVMGGEGGRVGWPLAEAARATADWRWVVLGSGWQSDIGDLGVGWVEDPFDWLCAADVVVSHAGHNALTECAAADRPMLVIPQDRPHDEQRHKAQLLQQHGLAVVAPQWPAAGAWPELLERTLDRSPDPKHRLVDGHGARRAAYIVQHAARRMGRQVQAA